MRILLLSAYDAASHRRWREGLVRYLGDFHWTVLTLPPRNFAWRSRGNALTWACGEREALSRKYDLLLATSMTDLASLRGMVPSLAKIPAVAYFHENQFAYPERAQRKEYLNYKLTNLYTALAADCVLFNSAYNKDTFLEGIREMLRLMPDGVPSGVVDLLGDRSEVLPVPLGKECFTLTPGAQGDGSLQVVWNHRWEHDKAPERFFKALESLIQQGVPFKVHILGQRFRDVPPVFAAVRERLRDRIGEFGFIEDPERYRCVLSQSDVIVSTALHDFQGLSVLDAAAAGCLPLVPDRLAYREFFPEENRYESLPDDPDREAEVLAGRLASLCSYPGKTRKMSVPDVSCLSWEVLGTRYREIMERTAARA
jgi:glycosyltransferase involved in cell wall biosynthesis